MSWSHCHVKPCASERVPVKTCTCCDHPPPFGVHIHTYIVISHHGSYHHQGRRGSDRPVVKFTGSVAPRMGVAEPLHRPTASRGRKRPRAAARLVGTSRAACRRSRLRVNPFLFWFVSFWLLFSGVWETLIFGTGDWFAFGEPFFCGLFTPTNPLPGHRLVPESQVISRRTFLRA